MPSSFFFDTTPDSETDSFYIFLHQTQSCFLFLMFLTTSMQFLFIFWQKCVTCDQCSKLLLKLQQLNVI